MDNRKVVFSLSPPISPPPLPNKSHPHGCDDIISNISRLDSYLTCYSDNGDELHFRSSHHHMGLPISVGGINSTYPLISSDRRDYGVEDCSPSLMPADRHVAELHHLDINHFLQQKIVQQKARWRKHRSVIIQINYFPCY